MNRFVKIERQISVGIFGTRGGHEYSGSEGTERDLSIRLPTKISGIFDIMERTQRYDDPCQIDPFERLWLINGFRLRRTLCYSTRNSTLI